MIIIKSINLYKENDIIGINYSSKKTRILWDFMDPTNPTKKKIPQSPQNRK